MICERCGHRQFRHRWSYVGGPCWPYCNCCAWDNYKTDNLKYLESLYEKKLEV
jgi:hypothetical protein